MCCSAHALALLLLLLQYVDSTDAAAKAGATTAVNNASESLETHQVY